MKSIPAQQLDLLVDHWVDEGLITAAQAHRMHVEVAAYEPADDATTAPDASRAASLLGQALGYLGGAIVLVGSVLIGSWYWDDLGTAPRLAVLIGAAGLLLSAGAIVPAPRGGAGEQLRSVLWLISTGAVAGALGVLATDVLETSEADTFLLVAGGTACYAAALWLVGHGVIQQIAMVVALALTAAAVINRADVAENLPGLGVWIVGLIWAVLGWREIAHPGRAALVLGSMLALIGAMATAGADAGMVFALITILAIIVAAVLLRDLFLLAVGTVGALINTPAAMTRWFPDSVAGAFALVVVGVLLVATAVWVTRSGHTRRVRSSGPSHG
ncbi:DUF2157 domain-containing protein [Nocardioides sp. NPDC000445]|uniref:DUF2157 domain-containing protein n=1 Tax=Nocardioides sp. NPDC000445 TaxID=3154257 RepID=UPI00332FF13E